MTVRIRADNENNIDWRKHEKAKLVAKQIINNITKRRGKIVLKNNKAIFSAR